MGKIPTAWAGWDWQSSNPDFTQLFNKVREVQPTNDNMVQIIALANANTATRSHEFVNVY